jgi:hypothetical protein
MEQADNKSGMFGARQMRNCLPCKKRKIKCGYRTMLTALTLQAIVESHVSLLSGYMCLTTSGGPCALRRDGKSCTPAVGKMEDIVDEVE